MTSKSADKPQPHPDHIPMTVRDFPDFDPEAAPNPVIAVVAHDTDANESDPKSAKPATKKEN